MVRGRSEQTLLRVCGSLGRASTTAMIAALLRACGLQLCETVSCGGDARLLRAGAEAVGGLSLEVWTPVTAREGRSAAEEARRLASDTSPTAVSGLQRESVLEVLRALRPELREVAALCALRRGRADLDGQEARLRTPRAEYRLTLPLLGSFQVENAATAVLAVEQLPDVALTPELAHTALAGLRLPGRLEALKRRPLVLVDSAEGVEEFHRLTQALRGELALRAPLFVLALEPESDPEALIRVLAPLEPELVLTPARADADVDLQRAAGSANDCDLSCRQASSLEEAIDDALAREGRAVCIAGSAGAAELARSLILGLLPPGTRLH